VSASSDPAFALSATTEDLRCRVHDFVETHVLPIERDRTHWDAHENIRLDVLDVLRLKAKAAGLWAPQAPTHLGGMGLSNVQRAVFYEEANRSIFGPVVFNCAAPDDGNIDILARVATHEQQARWLQPIIDGHVRSAFAMTEPAPGGGSDPGMIVTQATRHGDLWRISGRKWFITGAADAQHFILIARTNPDPAEQRKHLTAFMFHRDQPGWKIVRRIAIMGPEEHGGHCEIVFDGLEIHDRDRLMLLNRPLQGGTQGRLMNIERDHQ